MRKGLKRLVVAVALVATVTTAGRIVKRSAIDIDPPLPCYSMVQR